MNEVDKEGKKFDKTLYGAVDLESRTFDYSFIPCIPKHVKGHIHSEQDTECLADYDNPESLKQKLKAS
jgi:hypothetical protein